MRLGLDFDNTIACFDEVFCAAARAEGLLPPSFQGGKAAVKAWVQGLHDGERQWQRLQGRVYGAYMGQASLTAGVDGFLRRARDEGAELFVVSHKTVHGHFDPDRINLHDAARAWMTAHGFFAADVYGIPASHVYFEADRAAKVARIADLVLDVFIDDLPEVFAEPGFPASTRGILLTNATEVDAGPYRACKDWQEIGNAVLGRQD
jgi:hypothetical protein